MRWCLVYTQSYKQKIDINNIYSIMHHVVIFANIEVSFISYLKTDFAILPVFTLHKWEGHAVSYTPVPH